MNHQINTNICWLAHLAADIKDPYVYHHYESFSLETHPLGCPPPTGYHYPSQPRQPFIFIGGLELHSDSITNFERYLVCKIMIEDFLSGQKDYYFRKIIIEQPQDKPYPPIYFYEIKVGGYLFMVGGKTQIDSNELRRLEKLFDCMKWVYKIDIHELTIPFAQVHQRYLSLKEKSRAHEKELVSELEDMSPEEYYQDSERGW